VRALNALGAKKAAQNAGTRAAESNNTSGNKRTNQNQIQGPRTKEPRIFTAETPSPARTKVLEARNLLIEACALAKSHEEKTKILDLIDIVREFSEKGRIQNTASILTTQIVNLETVARKLEQRTQKLQNNPNPPFSTASSSTFQLDPSGRPLVQLAPAIPAAFPAKQATEPLSKTNPPQKTPFSYAQTAVLNQNVQNQPNQPQEWTLVQPAKPAKQAKLGSRENFKKRRLVLIRSMDTLENFSPFAVRNAFNAAFSNKGVKGPVVATVTKSLGQNIVVTTTSAFSAEFLLENRSIWEQVIPFQSIQRDQPWYKVVLHGIPIRDFDNAQGMALVHEEIKTFNKGFNPVGTSYWLTAPENRKNQLGGSVVVAFATAEEQARALRHRLYVAGISVRTEKLHATAPGTQCTRCQNYGHLQQHCKQDYKCGLCGEKHATQQHVCKTCKAKGTRCQHLVPKCSNCKEAHTADFKLCETRLASQARAQTGTPA
jgi:hypothetical protein